MILRTWLGVALLTLVPAATAIAQPQALKRARPAAAAPPAAAPRREPVTAQATVDPPAMWVADHVTYTIDLACSQGYDVLLEDLGRDRLKVEPMEVLDGRTAREVDRKSTRLNSSHYALSRMPSSA